jgi:hypothetical protein
MTMSQPDPVKPRPPTLPAPPVPAARPPLAAPLRREPPAAAGTRLAREAEGAGDGDTAPTAAGPRHGIAPLSAGVGVRERPADDRADAAGSAAAAFDAGRLGYRLARCLALQTQLTHAWSITMPLRRELAPHGELVLACDDTGRLHLRLDSADPTVLDAMHRQRERLLAEIAPWSHGPAEVRIGGLVCSSG